MWSTVARATTCTQVNLVTCLLQLFRVDCFTCSSYQPEFKSNCRQCNLYRVHFAYVSTKLLVTDAPTPQQKTISPSAYIQLFRHKELLLHSYHNLIARAEKIATPQARTSWQFDHTAKTRTSKPPICSHFLPLRTPNQRWMGRSSQPLHHTRYLAPEGGQTLFVFGLVTC